MLAADVSRALRQAYVIDTISGALTVVMVLLVAELKAIASHWQASVGAGIALVAIAVVVLGAVGHKERQNAEPTDDDDAGLRGSRGSSSSRDDAAGVANISLAELELSFFCAYPDEVDGERHGDLLQADTHRSLARTPTLADVLYNNPDATDSLRRDFEQILNADPQWSMGARRDEDKVNSQPEG